MPSTEPRTNTLKSTGLGCHTEEDSLQSGNMAEQTYIS